MLARMTVLENLRLGGLARGNGETARRTWSERSRCSRCSTRAGASSPEA